MTPGTFRRNQDFTKSIRRTASQRLEAATLVVRDQARKMLDRGDGDGVQHLGQDRASSAAGQAPVSQSGELYQSLKVYPPRDTDKAVEAAAGTDLFRHIWTEKGTARQAPRPLLYPALMESKEDVMRVMTGQSIKSDEQEVEDV